METILITGGEGVLGSYFDFGIRMGKKELDITDLDAVLKVCAEKKPEVIVHTAALTDLSVCEANPEKAYVVNAVGTYNIALGARAVGAKVVYVSTSDVFDGTGNEPYAEGDTPSPVSVYGHSKYLGELAVASIVKDHLIVRLSWMFGGGPTKDSKFVGKILRQQNTPEIRAVNDKRGSPSWGKDVAKSIQMLIDQNESGIHHLGGGVATRYEMAQEIVSLAGWNTKVVPVDSSEFVSTYPIGTNTSMSSSVPQRPWKESLAQYIESEWKEALTV